jgi:hypothetical protein
MGSPAVIRTLRLVTYERATVNRETVARPAVLFGQVGKSQLAGEEEREFDPGRGRAIAEHGPNLTGMKLISTKRLLKQLKRAEVLPRWVVSGSALHPLLESRSFFVGDSQKKEGRFH